MTTRSSESPSNMQATFGHSGSSEDSICPTTSSMAMPTFLSPSECLRGLNNEELMQIADNGEVFQEFVRSMSSGELMSPSPTSLGAIAKSSRGTPTTSNSKFRRRQTSSSTSSIRVLTHEHDAERNLRLYLKDSVRDGKDRRHLFRRRLVKEEEDRLREMDEQAEQLLRVESPVRFSSLFNARTSSDDFKEKTFDKTGLVYFDETDAISARQQLKEAKKVETRKPKKTSIFRRIFNRLTFRRRIRRCPFFCSANDDDYHESPEEFLQRMDDYVTFTAFNSRASRWRRARQRIGRWLSSVKGSIIRVTRFLFCCHNPSSI